MGSIKTASQSRCLQYHRASAIVCLWALNSFSFMINNCKFLFMIIHLCGNVLHTAVCLPSRPKIWDVKRRDKIPEKAVGCLPAPSCKSNGKLIHACIWKRRQWMYRCIYTTQSKVILRLQFYSYRVQAWMGTNAQQRVTLYIIMQHTWAQIQVKTLIWCWILFFSHKFRTFFENTLRQAKPRG